MNCNDISLSAYLALFGSEAGGRAVRWQIAKEHQERIGILEEALSDCYNRLIETRGLNKKQSEDELSMQIVNMLCTAGIHATHDRHVNGHCDIVVDAKDGFMWLGEAKVHKDYAWLEDGFLQLSTRYGAAVTGRDHGELIIYHRQGDSKKVLKTWLQIIQENFPYVAIEEDSTEKYLNFRTKHKCQNSGCNFFVRHSIVPLMHSPQK